MKLLAASLLYAAAATGVSDNVNSLNTLSAEVKNVRGNLDGSKIIRVALPTDDEAAGTDTATLIGQMIESIDGDEWGKTEEGLDIMVPKSAFDALRAVNFKYEDRTEDWLNEFQKNFEDPNFVCQETSRSCAKSNNFYR